jgi:hypothetical protein
VSAAVLVRAGAGREALVSACAICTRGAAALCPAAAGGHADDPVAPAVPARQQSPNPLVTMAPLAPLVT